MSVLARHMRFVVWASDPDTELAFVSTTLPGHDEDRFACRCVNPLHPTRSCPSHSARAWWCRKYGLGLDGEPYVDSGFRR